MSSENHSKVHSVSTIFASARSRSDGGLIRLLSLTRTSGNPAPPRSIGPGSSG